MDWGEGLSMWPFETRSVTVMRAWLVFSVWGILLRAIGEQWRRHMLDKNAISRERQKPYC